MKALRILQFPTFGLVLAFFSPIVLGSPFIPQDWQQLVKAGPLAGQRKHLGWNRDLNKNYVDDQLEAMPAGEKTTVIVQLNECYSRQDLQARFGAFGTIRRVGVLVAYVILDNVKAGDAAAIANDPGVAAVEYDEPVFTFNDVATRVVRARASNTFSPETFADAYPAFDGTGINIAIVDTGVDDAVHASFAGKFVSGYDAVAGVAVNPNDNLGNTIGIGPNGICNTAAAGDDQQLIAVGSGNSGIIAVRAGPNGTIESVVGGDDFVGTLGFCDGTSEQAVGVGANGISNTTAIGDDIQVLPVGTAAASFPAIGAGPNGVLDTVPAGDDVITTGVWHGTHVAGIAMGLGVGPGCRTPDDGSTPNNCGGMAPGAGLVDVKVLDHNGSGFTSDIIDGLEWLFLDGNTRVVNMSLGNNTPSDGSSVLSKSINALVEHGITVVVAAGNSGHACLGDSASSELAITVAASDDHGTVDRDDDTIAPFSTIGPRLDFSLLSPLVGQLKPDVTAPGTSITSAQGDSAGSYHALNGTSMAAPNVAGAAALLLDKNPNIQPGSLKELLKRTAYQTPEHAGLGASFPGVDGTYNVKWGWGLLDVYQAGVGMDAGIADITFTECNGSNCGGNCPRAAGPSWANNVDILLETDPPVQGELNHITLNVQNRSAALAENVVVCVGVYPLGIGLQGYYAVGCKTVDIPALSTISVSFPWTPIPNDHQCIQATINYAFDTDYCNNQTQRNTAPVPASSVAIAHFRIENPFNEPATIQIEPRFGGGNDNVRIDYKGPRQIFLKPEDCPVLAEVAFVPNPGTPIGAKATWRIFGTAFTASHPQGVELNGVEFNVVLVAAGLERAYSVGTHGPEGEIKLPLNLAGTPTSDPRLRVDEVLAVFNVTVDTLDHLLKPEDVVITSQKGNPIPAYTVAFAEGVNQGKQLTIHFSAPLTDQDRYRFDFSRFMDTDGDALQGDTNFDLRVLQGDANNSGAVTATDVSFVRGRINDAVAFGQTSRADVNLTGSLTGTDISFVRSRIGHSAP